MSIHHNTAIASVNTLESLGYTYNEGAEFWTPPLDMECKDALAKQRDELAKELVFHAKDAVKERNRAEKAEAEVIMLRKALEMGTDLIRGDTVGREWKLGCAAFLKQARAALSKTPTTSS